MTVWDVDRGTSASRNLRLGVVMWIDTFLSLSLSFLPTYLSFILILCLHQSWSTTIGLVFDSIKFVGIVIVSTFCIHASIVCRNMGTKFNSLFIFIVIGNRQELAELGRPPQLMLRLCFLVAYIRGSPHWPLRPMLLGFGNVVQNLPIGCLHLALGVTCWTSIVIVLTAGPFPLSRRKHWVAQCPGCLLEIRY